MQRPQGVVLPGLYGRVGSHGIVRARGGSVHGRGGGRGRGSAIRCTRTGASVPGVSQKGDKRLDGPLSSQGVLGGAVVVAPAGEAPRHGKERACGGGSHGGVGWTRLEGRDDPCGNITVEHGIRETCGADGAGLAPLGE